MKSKKTPAAERPSEFGNESGYPPTRLKREAMRDAEAAAREREAASAASKLKTAMQSLDDTGLQLSAEQEKALLARMGDALTVAGTLTLKGYLDKEGQPRPGLDVVAHQVLTAYAISHKRAAVQPADTAPAI